MKNKLTLTTVALAIMAVTNASGAASIKQIEKVNAQVFKKSQVNKPSFAEWQNLQKSKKNDFTDRLIIKYKSGVGPMTRVSSNGKNVSLLTSLSTLTNIKLQHVSTLKNGDSIISFGSEKNIKEVQAIAKKLAMNTSVDTVEPDYKRFFMAQNQPWGIAKTQSNQLSDNDAANMKVCIIDSGYQRSNPDLTANNANGTNDSGTGNWYENGGSHGTHVAGTIAGINNSEGVVGILPNKNVNLHIVKVFNASGWGYSSTLVSAINTCIDNGSKVINMSLGGANSSTAEKNAMQTAADAGVLLIAASGNDGNSTLSYPASYDAVMAVGAVDSNNQHAEFSQYTSQVEVSAPGEAILSTVAGDGRLGYITVGSTTHGNDNVVPQTHYVQNGSDFVVSNVNGSASGVLASCTISGSSYSCSNVNGNICLAERNDNQKGSNYPEINPAKACADAGASAVIVYSNSTRPGLQNPFLVDANTDVTVPTVSVSRTLGQQLMTQLGTNASLTVNGSQNYAYYNGTSMATPHVTGVAALVWSNNPNCSADDVRSALKNTAVDLGSAGRDDKTGFGLVQSKAASDALSTSCNGTTTPTVGVLDNGIAKTNLTSSTDLNFTMEVSAGATDLSFDMAGGTGDADLYVKFGSAPTSNDYDCRPFKNGNNESCPISNAQAGTYYISLVPYSAFSGLSLTGSFTEPSTGGSASVTDISIARRAWKYYTIDIPAGMATLEFVMSGGTGDGDMHIRKGAQPTSTTYDCRPFEGGNNETCSFNNPTADTWHIGIYAYSRVNGASLDVTYNP